MVLIIYNRNDDCLKTAKKDGFSVYPIDQAVKRADIIMMLIPDAAQANIYNEFIDPHIKDGTMLVIAHGYSITFGGLKINRNIDITLLAPRFPGQIIRQNYLQGLGTLAFFDSYQDVTNTGKLRGLALAQAIGLTKLLEVGLKEETYADLFIENFLIPRLRGTIEICYKLLVESGVSPEVAALESYQSGEILGLLEDGLRLGIYESFHSQTSPTCQFGVAYSHDKVNLGAEEIGDEIYREILSGNFTQKLVAEEAQNYPIKNGYNQKNLNSQFSKILKKLREEL